MAPWLVGVASRAASRLPTTPRLALRDAGRNRLRAGTAVSAVLAAVAGAAAMGIWVASDSANAERHYVQTVPEGYVAVTVDHGAWPGGDFSTVEDALPTEMAVPMTGMAGWPCPFKRCSDWKVKQQTDPCSVVLSDAGSVCGLLVRKCLETLDVRRRTAYRALTGAEPSSTSQRPLPR